MKITLQQLVESKAALDAISAQKPSVRMGYTIAMILAEVEPHLKAYQQAIDVVKERYFTPNPDNPDLLNLVKDPDKREAYKKEVEDLHNAEIDLNLGTLPASKLDAEGVKLTPQEAHLLRWLIRNDIEPMFDKE